MSEPAATPRLAPQHRPVQLPEDFDRACRGFAQHAATITDHLHQVDALLRLLQFRFTHGDPETFTMDDVDALVSLARGRLPHYDDDVYNAADKFSTAARNAVRAAILREEALECFFRAMTVLARGDQSLQAIQAAIDDVHRIAREDAVYAPAWHAFVSAIESWGWTLDVVKYGETTIGPTVQPPEMAALNRKRDRAMNKFVAAFHEGSATGKKRYRRTPR